MSIRSIFLWIIVLFFLAVPVKTEAQVSLTWKVMKFDMTCQLPSNFDSDRNADITAVIDLKNQSARSFDQVTLRISEFAKISSVTAGGNTVDFRSSTEKLTDSQKLQKIQVRVGDIPQGETVRVTVKYKLAVGANSGLDALSPAGSQFLPYSFWYPVPTSWYFPEGADNAPFDITVNGIGDQTLVTAGTGEGTKFSNGIRGMPFFLTGKWHKSEHSGTQVFAPTGAQLIERAEEMAAVANEAKAFAEESLGQKLTTPIKIVAVGRGSGFSESGTILVDIGAFRSRSLDSKTAVAISEAVMKTFLGNVIEVRGAGYGVVREGLSRFLSNRFIEKKYGPAVARVVRLRQLTNYAAIADKDAPLSIVSPVDGYFYSAAGNKGSMIWNFLYRKSENQFFNIIRSASADGELSLAELRSLFSGQKEYLDYAVEKVTEMNLMVGAPQVEGKVTKSALRNFGEIDAVVEVVGIDEEGKEHKINVTIPAKGFAEARFETASKIVSVEVDPDKLYTQLTYSDDVAPRVINESDPIVFIKKDFDRQKFSAAAQNAVVVLNKYSEFDDARVLLARSYLAQDKITDARVQFERVLNSDLPSPQSIAWSLVGLGDAARKSGQQDAAIKYYNEAIQSDAEYGATLAARRGRVQTGKLPPVPADVTAFFSAFDSALVSNSKQAQAGVIMSGEVSRFAVSVTGQVQTWQSRVVSVDIVNSETVLVETEVSFKLLNREIESGIAVFRLSRVGNSYRVSNIDIFETS